jgi:periplasmic iron binding protein
MKRILYAMSLAAAALAANWPAAAKEFYVGEPVVKNDMQLVPHYLLGIEMAPMVKGMDMGPNAIHLEIDVHATKDDKHGFKEDEWIPYVTISYTIEKVGTKLKKTGQLLPMTAGDGPHYANNVALMGDGDYQVTFRFEPPSKAGFIRHVDKARVATVFANLDIPFPEQTGRVTAPMSRPAVFLVLAMLGAPCGSASAEDAYAATITIRDHRFDPAELHVPAGKRILLTVINADLLSEEFDSAALKVEKVIAGKSQGVVHISPLNPGSYDFIGEYHEDTAKGRVIAE